MGVCDVCKLPAKRTHTGVSGQNMDSTSNHGHTQFPVMPSGVARAFLGGHLAHQEGQNKEENEERLRKNKKNLSRFEGK